MVSDSIVDEMKKIRTRRGSTKHTSIDMSLFLGRSMQLLIEQVLDDTGA
jgi:hypothetical protein